MKQEIERFGGTVEKFVGDAVMAVFGAPVAHEDDAERAVRAALRILDAIDDLREARKSSTWPYEPPSPPARPSSRCAPVRVQARGSRPAMSSTRQPASRARPPSGGIIVGEQTYRSTRHAIRYEQLPALALKGKGEAVPAWRALSAKSRFGVDAERRRRRRSSDETESSACSRTRRPHARRVRRSSSQPSRASRASARRACWPSSEPGRRRAAELVSWRQGRCLPYGEGITFWALGEIVKAHAGILESDGQADAAAKLRAAVEATDDGAWLQARLGPLVGLTGTDAAEREESFAAWQRFLESIATTGPLVLLFEDLHWADPALLAFIEHLVDWSRELPILVLCTARPELFERHAGWGGGLRNAATVSLSPLSSDETARLVAELLDTAVLPAETQAALLERAGGNPLYAEEYVRLFLEQGSAEDLPLPDTVQGLIAARLDTLPPERKALLHDAAVIGKVFWAGALQAMGDRSVEDVREGLHQLARKELLRPARLSSVASQAEYSFWHALVRDVAYGQIPRAERAAKHRAAADWLEQMAGERIADHADLLAYHATEALVLARAAGEEPDRALERRAARYLVLAGDRSFELDLSTAGTLYRRALELLPEGSEEHGLALLKTGEVAQFEARFEDAREDIERAATELAAAGAMRSAGAAYGLLGNVYFQLGSAERMEEALNRALETLEPLPPGPELADLYGRMAALESMKAQRPERALEWAQKAITLGEELGERNLIRGLMWRGLMRCELGDLAGIEDLERAQRDALDLRVAVTPAHVNLADQVWRLRGPAAALEIQHAGIADRLSHGGTEPTWLQAESCWMLYDLGRWDELTNVAEAVARFEEQHGAARPGRHGANVCSCSCPLAGRARRRRSHGAPRSNARRSSIRRSAAPAIVMAALAEMRHDELERALELVREYLDVTRSRPFFRSQNLTDAVRVACAAGDVALGERLLDNIVTAAERDRLCTSTATATIAEAHGDSAGAGAPTRRPPRVGGRSAAGSSTRSRSEVRARTPGRRRSSRSWGWFRLRLRPRQHERRSSSPGAARGRAATRRAARVAQCGHRA